MAILMFVTLFSSRILLQVIGISDFGIYNVVGGFVAMLAFFTSSLANVTQRYLNLSIGMVNKELSKHYFAQSFTIILLFSLAVLFVAESIGLWFVYNKLNIPENRHFAAMCVYQFSIVSVICSINQTTFLGAIVAHEKMNIYAYVGLFEGIGRLLIIFLLKSCDIDHLILYSALMSVISLICTIIYVLYSRRFETYNLTFCWDKQLIVNMGKLIGYNLFGCFAYSAGVQGSNIILNLFFGPIVNASRGIALQVNSVAIRFTEGIMTAFKPQIIKSYASHDIHYMHLLIEKGSKYSLFLSLLISVPILLKTDYILYLWLNDVPTYSAVFTKLAIIEALIGTLINPLIIATYATGNIVNNQVWGRLITLSAVIFNYVALCIYPNPTIPIVILVIVQFMYWLYCLYDTKNQIGLNLLSYFKNICIPSSVLLFMMGCASIVINKLFDSNNLVNFIFAEIAIILFDFIALYAVLDKNEKRAVNTRIIQLINKYT